MFQRFLVGLTVCLVAAGWAFAAPPVTFESLLNEMVDLETLSRFPDPAFTCKQFSSYDQRSTDPSVATDDNWFANADRGQHLRVEERNGAQEWVMMDAQGPGAVVRIWSANPVDAGILRIYIDGADQPVIELPATIVLGGGSLPFLSPISGERSKGWNCYLPIPYAQSCKITASKPDFYYQINYRTYVPDATVESFGHDAIATNADKVHEVAAALASPALAAPAPAKASATAYSETIAAGKSMTARLTGGGAVYRLTATVKAPDLAKALRGCLLEIAFDGGAPTVQVPLGDFFGTAPGPNPYVSLPSGVLADGSMYAHWVMPFSESAVIQVANHTDQDVAISGEIVTGPYQWTDNAMHFHAKWRSEHPIPTKPRQDWTYLQVEGKGVFVGDMLHVVNPVIDWWGEGDEKIYVDGETFPSHFGTGTEDYYGYAWCWPAVFTHAYHNQPRCDGPGNYGHTCVSRFHILDRIPFQQSFKFDMEVWHWAECEVGMSATSYWYAFPGATDHFAPIDPVQLVVTAPAPLPKPAAASDIIEGENLLVLAQTGGNVQVQRGGFGWSGGGQLWWSDAKPGDRIRVSVKVPETGWYEVGGVFTRAPDYGIVKFVIGDYEISETVDFYGESVQPTEFINGGLMHLDKGVQTFDVIMVDKNEKSTGYMFGIDYIAMRPAK